MQNTSYFSIQVIGDFTAKKAIEVKNTSTDLVEKGNTNLLIDLTKTSDVDVVSMNALAMIYKHVRSENGNLIIHLTKGSHLSKMLCLTKFEKIFTLIYP